MGSSSASLLHRVGRIFIDGDAGQRELARISHCSSAIQLEQACFVLNLDQVKCLRCVRLISIFSTVRVRAAPIQLCRSGLAYRRSIGSSILCSSAAMGRCVDLVVPGRRHWDLHPGDASRKLALDIYWASRSVEVGKDVGNSLGLAEVMSQLEIEAKAESKITSLLRTTSP